MIRLDGKLVDVPRGRYIPKVPEKVGVMESCPNLVPTVVEPTVPVNLPTPEEVEKWEVDTAIAEMNAFYEKVARVYPNG